jgi:hypothetical protein
MVSVVGCSLKKREREEEEEKILKIPGIRYFNNDWNLLQKFLESQGYPRYSIGGDLDLSESDIETLGNLVRVEGDLDLRRCFNLQSLGNLEYVGGKLSLFNSKYLESLGDLKYVGGDLVLISTPLSKKYTEEQIRRMVEVDGVIYMG